MADVLHFNKDEFWEFNATFRVDGVPTNPTDVTGTALKPDGTTITLQPGSDIVNIDPGVYRVREVGDQVGDWYVEVVGTGAAASTERFHLYIDPRWPKDLLNSDALTTIENVELVLDRVGVQGSRADEEDDLRWIASLINGFSDSIHNHTGRQFKPTEDDASKVFHYDGSGTLSLAPYEARAINTVTAYTDREVGEQEVWTPGYTGTGNDYWAHPLQKTKEGTYLYLAVPRVYRWASYPITAQVTINADWGAGIVPDDVRYVCDQEVANAYVRSTARVTTLEGTLVNDVGPFALSQRSIALLEPYSNRALMIA